MKPNIRELKCIEYRQELLEPDPFIRSVRLKSEEEIERDSKVSREKTFSQLWEDQGIQKIGVEYYDMKQKCMQKWVEILYDIDLDLEKLVQEEIEEQVAYRKKLSKSGIRLNLAHPIDLLPEKIDEFLGSYA